MTTSGPQRSRRTSIKTAPGFARDAKVNITTTRGREFANVNPFLSTHSHTHTHTHIHIYIYIYIHRHIQECVVKMDIYIYYIYIHIWEENRTLNMIQEWFDSLLLLLYFLFWYISWHLEICNKHFLRKRVGLCGDRICIEIILNISRELI